MSISDKKSRVVAIVGPTASGKSTLAIELAQRFGGEIVSADSRQIYRGMDIGTAKPSVADQALVPHHLIDIKDPSEEYTVVDYKNDAIAVIRDILSRKKLPVIAGGTGLYVKASLENLDIPRVSSDGGLRKKLETEVEERGLPALFEKLLTLDPEAENVVDPKNPRRVIRALEVAITTGEPFTAQRKKNAPLFDALIIGLDVPPEILRKRIDERIDTMIRDGLVDEAEALVKKYGAEAPAFNAIGYREIIDYLSKRSSLEEAIAQIKMNTWHYARRQMTWFRKDKNVQWVKNQEDVIPLIQKFLI